jgi:hypothetical protein
VRNEDVLQRVKKDSYVLHTTKRKEGLLGWSHFRNCLLKCFIEGKIEGKIEGTRRRGKRLEQLLDNVKVKTIHWNLKETALDLTLRRTCFARGCVTCRKQRHRLLCAKGAFYSFRCGISTD